jgi:hypothetical protein
MYALNDDENNLEELYIIIYYLNFNIEDVVENHRCYPYDRTLNKLYMYIQFCFGLTAVIDTSQRQYNHFIVRFEI